MNRSGTLLPACFALLGTLLGYAIASAPSSDAPTPAPETLAPGAGDDSLAPLLAEVRALGDRIEALAARPAPAAAPGTAREPVGDAEAVDDERVLEMLERCTALIERIERASVESDRGGLLPPPETADRNAIALPEGLSPAEQDVWEQELMSRHRLWSYQEVLDAYGAPDQIYTTTSEIRWYYALEKQTGETDNVNFRFGDGMVIAVTFN